jgi:hypothetical protein
MIGPWPSINSHAGNEFQVLLASFSIMRSRQTGGQQSHFHAKSLIYAYIKVALQALHIRLFVCLHRLSLPECFAELPHTVLEAFLKFSEIELI